MVNAKNIILGIGIVVIYALVLWQGIEAFYPSPQHDDFCKSSIFDSGPFVKSADRGTSCNFTKDLQEQQDQCYTQKGFPVYEYDNNGCTVKIKECNMCNEELNEAQDKHSKAVFVIAIIAGIITLIVGYSILSVEPVGSALMGSGIWAIFWGAAINWRSFSSVLRFLLLLIALVVIIWFALRLNRSEKKNIWQKIGLKK